MKLTDKEIETALRAQKYIRRKCWHEENYTIRHSSVFGFVLEVRESEKKMDLDDFLADDWEIVQ